MKSLSTFSGNEIYSVKDWIMEFEQQADFCEWTNQQRLIYGKRLMKGTAKDHLRICKVKSWREMKKELIQEFNIELSSADAHALMQKTKKKRIMKPCANISLK